LTFLQTNHHKTNNLFSNPIVFIIFLKAIKLAINYNTTSTK